MISMTPCQELYELLNSEILKEFESVIAQIDAFAKENELNDDQIEERHNIHTLFDHFHQIANGIEHEAIDSEQCKQILDEFQMMRQMGEQAGI